MDAAGEFDCGSERLIERFIRTQTLRQTAIRWDQSSALPRPSGGQIVNLKFRGLGLNLPACAGFVMKSRDYEGQA